MSIGDFIEKLQKRNNNTFVPLEGVNCVQGMVFSFLVLHDVRWAVMPNVAIKVQ